jgi:hypothetical protein
MKKFVAFLLFAGAVTLFFYAKKTLAADRAETRMLIRQMAEAQERYDEISRLKSLMLMQNFDVVSKELEHKDPGSEKAELQRNRAELGQLETAERMLGSVSAQESVLKDLQNHHWVILGEFVGAGLLALFGLLVLA